MHDSHATLEGEVGCARLAGIGANYRRAWAGGQGTGKKRVVVVRLVVSLVRFCVRNHWNRRYSPRCTH